MKKWNASIIAAYIAGWLARDDLADETPDDFDHSILSGLQRIPLTADISLGLVSLWIQWVENRTLEQAVKLIKKSACGDDDDEVLGFTEHEK